MTARADVLTDAAALIVGERQSDYGEPVENMRHIVQIFNAWTGQKLTARQGVQFLMAVKMARLEHSPMHRDSHVDLAGYDGILYECALAE